MAEAKGLGASLPILQGLIIHSLHPWFSLEPPKLSQVVLAHSKGPGTRVDLRKDTPRSVLVLRAQLFVYQNQDNRNHQRQETPGASMILPKCGYYPN